MCTRRAVVLFFFVLGISAALGAVAKLPLTHLRDLVESANWIVIGPVVAIEDGGVSKEFGVPVKVARIRPDRFLKGAKQERLEIAFMPAVSEEPNFVLKETYLLFLKRTPSGAEVVVGYLGALMIKDGFVKTGEINDEPELQSVDTFVERIGIAMQVPTTH